MDFLDRRRAPLAAPPAPPLARPARQGRGVQRRSKNSARTSESLCLWRFFFYTSRGTIKIDMGVLKLVAGYGVLAALS